MKLSQMLKEVNLKVIKDPCDPIGPTEKVAKGKASNTLKKLYHLVRAAGENANNHKLALREKVRKHDEKHQTEKVSAACCETHIRDVQKNIEEIRNATAVLNNLHEIYWANVRLEFPELLRKERIGVRKNWTFVWDEAEEEEDEGEESRRTAIITVGGAESEFLLALLSRFGQPPVSQSPS